MWIWLDIFLECLAWYYSSYQIIMQFGRFVYLLIDRLSTIKVYAVGLIKYFAIIWFQFGVKCKYMLIFKHHKIKIFFS